MDDDRDVFATLAGGSSEILAVLASDRAQAVLALLGEPARIVAGGRGEVLERLDPRAIDARSAALGQYQPQRRRPGG